MSIVNLKESLLQMDRDTDCKYDLTTLYEACNLDEKKKKQLVQFVNNYDIEATNNLLSNEASSQGLMETVEDDLSDEELKDFHIEVEESLNEEKINITVNSTDREPPEKYVYNSITDAKQGIKRNGICKDDISNISGCDIEDLFESINESNNMNDDDLWEVIDDEEFEFHGVQDVGYDDDGNIVVVFNHAISDEIIEPTAEELLTAFRQYGYPVHDWNTNGTNVFILTSGNILNSISEATQGIKASNSRLNEIRDEINKAVKKVMMSPEFGFLEDEVDEYSVVEVSDENDRIKVEVRAEVNYDDLMQLCNELNKIISKYDKDAYFEPVTSGIIDAYISKNQSNNKRDYFESIDESVADNYDEYNTITYQRTKYSIHYTHINTDPNADSLQMFKEFKATVSEIHPYDDADYTWAQIENGIIKYIKNGKVIDKSYYMTAEDWDLENNEWCDAVIDEAVYNLAELNKDVEPKMIHESKSKNEGLTLKEDMWDYESDFSDGEVEAGDTFDYEGVEYEWIQQYGDTAHLDFDAWAIWEASPVDMDDDNPETKFFIVDVDTGFIDWDCDSLREAQEFLDSKIDDYNSDDDNEFDYYDITEGIEDDELSTPDQEFDSAATSINSNKLPAIYRMITIPEGTIGVDFGGGRFDNAVEHIKDLGATLCVYDPYNRSAEHNKEVIKTLRSNGGADWAINSNVLNVIKEPEARKAVLENISKITKAGAPIYITVYEGRGDNKEGPTKSGYQLNRKTADYLEDIQEVFPDATRKGKLIIAHNSKSISEEVQPKLSTNSKGDYLVKASSGKGYTVFNKDDTCIGGFDGENDQEAKNKFMSGKINEDMEGQFSNKFFKLAAKYGEDNELYPLVKNLIRYTKEEDLKDLWYDKGYNKQEDSDDVDESIYTPNSKSQIEEEIKKITNNFTIKEDTIQCGFKEECDSAVNLLKENYTKVKSQKVGDWFRINFSK